LRTLRARRTLVALCRGQAYHRAAFSCFVAWINNGPLNRSKLYLERFQLSVQSRFSFFIFSIFCTWAPFRQTIQIVVGNTRTLNNKKKDRGQGEEKARCGAMLPWRRWCSCASSSWPLHNLYANASLLCSLDTNCKKYQYINCPLFLCCTAVFPNYVINLLFFPFSRGNAARRTPPR